MIETKVAIGKEKLEEKKKTSCGHAEVHHHSDTESFKSDDSFEESSSSKSKKESEEKPKGRPSLWGGWAKKAGDEADKKAAEEAARKASEEKPKKPSVFGIWASKAEH